MFFIRHIWTHEFTSPRSEGIGEFFNAPSCRDLKGEPIFSCHHSLSQGNNPLSSPSRLVLTLGPTTRTQQRKFPGSRVLQHPRFWVTKFTSGNLVPSVKFFWFRNSSHTASDPPDPDDFGTVPVRLPLGHSGGTFQQPGAFRAPLFWPQDHPSFFGNIRWGHHAVYFSTSNPVSRSHVSLFWPPRCGCNIPTGGPYFTPWCAPSAPRRFLWGAPQRAMIFLLSTCSHPGVPSNQHPFCGRLVAHHTCGPPAR